MLPVIYKDLGNEIASGPARLFTFVVENWQERRAS
jgi:hypothetical protein